MLLQIFTLAVFSHLGAAKYKPFSLDKGLTTEDKQYLLNVHNTFRSWVAQGKDYHSVPAADMNRLVWNDGLAARAQKHADDCVGPSHDKEPNRIVGTNFKTAGQNMMDCTKAGICADEAMDAFFEEGKAYYFGRAGGDECDEAETAGKTCGHYLQLVWSITAYVGCGYNKCATDGKFARLVCNYGEAGVYVGKLPYKKGAACSQCQKGRGFCLDGLCLSKEDRELVAESLKAKITCSVSESKCTGNGGTFNADDCKCSCPSSKSGSNCEESCVDSYGDNCSRMKTYCTSSSYATWMASNCAKTCGHCAKAPETHEQNTDIKLEPETENIVLPGTGKKDCREGNGSTYKGEWSHGYTGVSCVEWATSKYASSVAGDSTAGKFCRNPGGKSAYPWCAIAARPYWQYCNVPPC